MSDLRKTNIHKSRSGYVRPRETGYVRPSLGSKGEAETLAIGNACGQSPNPQEIHSRSLLIFRANS